MRQGRNPTGCFRTRVKVASVGRSTSYRKNNAFTVSCAVRQGRNPTGCFRTRVRVASVGRSISCRENNVLTVGSAGRATCEAKHRQKNRVDSQHMGSAPAPLIRMFLAQIIGRLESVARSGRRNDLVPPPSTCTRARGEGVSPTPRICQPRGLDWGFALAASRCSDRYREGSERGQSVPSLPTEQAFGLRLSDHRTKNGSNQFQDLSRRR